LRTLQAWWWIRREVRKILERRFPGRSYHFASNLMSRYDAFVSYNRMDEKLAKPVVRLLGVNERRVFWDAEIQPGQRWRERIAEALANANTFVVLWCCHSANSQYVNAEIDAALAYGKPFWPVLVCPYPPRVPIDDIQGVDFREVMRHTCIDDHPSGDSLAREAARTFVLERFAPEAENPEAAVNDWLKASVARSRPSAAAGCVAATLGALSMVLALLSPSVSYLTSGIETFVNGAAVLIGLMLVFFGVRAVRRSTTPVRAEPASLLLAAVIETAIRETERGATTRRLIRI
jgi:hypothetical protein